MILDTLKHRKPYQVPIIPVLLLKCFSTVIMPNTQTTITIPLIFRQKTLQLKTKICVCLILETIQKCISAWYAAKIFNFTHCFSQSVYFNTVNYSTFLQKSDAILNSRPLCCNPGKKHY